MGTSLIDRPQTRVLLCTYGTCEVDYRFGAICPDLGTECASSELLAQSCGWHTMS
jgi:hypothetical protein